jgi:hypothetical protein
MLLGDGQLDDGCPCPLQLEQIKLLFLELPLFFFSFSFPKLVAKACICLARLINIASLGLDGAVTVG